MPRKPKGNEGELAPKANEAAPNTEASEMESSKPEKQAPSPRTRKTTRKTAKDENKVDTVQAEVQTPAPEDTGKPTDKKPKGRPKKNASRSSLFSSKESAPKNEEGVSVAPEEAHVQTIQDTIAFEPEEETVAVEPLESVATDEQLRTTIHVEPEEPAVSVPEKQREEEVEAVPKGEPDRKDNIREMEVDIRKLNNMNIKDLYTLAKKYSINGYTGMRKNDLVFSILQAQAKSFGYFFNEGVLDIIPVEGYGFLRTGNLLPGNNEDIYVSQSQIRKFNLNAGDIVSGQVRAPKEGEKFFALLRIEAINHNPPDRIYDRINFENLTAIYPVNKFKIENDPQKLSARIIDLFCPIGKGQRGLIVSPPKAGKTTILKDIANGIAKNHPETLRIVLLIDERPEEVTDITRSVDAQVLAAPFDMPPEKQIKVAQLTLQMAKRLAEYKYDVVILLDSITRLARAYNNYIPPSGKLLSGGVDPKALYGPKYFFGAARNIEEGGSLTIIATALVDTGSKMDDVIFEEFKGTGNMELILSRQLADRRIFPAINLQLSSTRREELLLSPEELRKVWILRKMLSTMGEEEGLTLILKKMKETSTNEFFLTLLDKERSRY